MRAGSEPQPGGTLHIPEQVGLGPHPDKAGGAGTRAPAFTSTCVREESAEGKDVGDASRDELEQCKPLKLDWRKPGCTLFADQQESLQRLTGKGQDDPYSG